MIDYDNLAKQYGGVDYDSIAKQLGGKVAGQTPFQQPVKQQGLFQKITNVLTSSEQKFGQDIGKAFYLTGGGQKQINEIAQQNLNSGDQRVSLAKTTVDPERKQRLLNFAVDDFKAGGMTSEQIIGQIKSNEQYLGDVGGVLLDILSVGTYGKIATGIVEAPRTVGILQGAIQGAKAGAKAGVVLGTAYGITGAMQKGETTKNVVISGIESGVVGTVAGGVVGGIAGGISGGIEARKLGVAEQQNALNAIIPTPKELKPTEYDKYFQSGRITPKTITGTAKIIPTDKEITLANQYSDLLQSKDPVKNGVDVLEEIVRDSNDVESYLQKQNITYNKTELKTALTEKLKPITDVFVPNEKRLTSMKTGLIDNFIEDVNSNNLTDLYKARKNYDQFIEKRLNAFSGSPTLKKDLSISMRNGVQEFITNQLGEGTYKKAMKDMTNLYDILNMLEVKAMKEKGLSIITALIKKHSVFMKLVGLATAFGLGVGTGVGVLKKISE